MLASAGLSLALGCATTPPVVSPPDAPADRGADATWEATVDLGPETVRDVPADLAEEPEAPPVEPDPACTRNGCLRAVSLVGRFARSVVAVLLSPGVAIDNGYSVYTVRFYTDGLESLATVAIPYDPGLVPPAAGWHVVGNSHGTSGLDDPCALSGTAAGPGLAGLFGARGMIGVAVDQPGLGTPGVHPYLVSQVEGRASLDGLRAARQLATREHVPLSGRYALVGLSQGGHVTIAAAAQHADYAPDLDLRAFAAVAPASVFEAQWSAAMAFPGVHISLHAMMIYAWSAHYRWPSTSLWTEAFARDVDATMTRLCVVSATGPTIVSQVPIDPALVFHPDLLRAYRTRAWGSYGFVHEAFQQNALRPYRQTAPLRIYQGDADTTVLESQTRELVGVLRTGGVTVDYQVVPGGLHANVAFGFVAYPELRTAESIAWVRTQLEARR